MTPPKPAYKSRDMSHNRETPTMTAQLAIYRDTLRHVKAP